MRTKAKQLLPPIVAEPLRRLRDRLRSSDSLDWEYRAAGWPDSDPTIHGWDAESVLATQLARWPAFVGSVEGSGPFGLSNEAAGPTDGDYRTHNTVMSFGYVLARAAWGRSRLSMLDWGGGIGQYSIYAKALLPEVEHEYHCRDLSLLTAGGREVLPDATFHDTDESALARTYDLVLASSSLHYSRDWRGTLARLASVTKRYLYVTRQPLVETAPSFVVVQRPYRYGYMTEYPGWFLNRTEFLGEARGLGLALIREFLIAERPVVPGAPEQADYRGFLFAAPAGQETA
jgi:putative methyltransferase (TIGR04325 family)